jgi:hypothetical protein
MDERISRVRRLVSFALVQTRQLYLPFFSAGELGPALQKRGKAIPKSI